MSTTRWTDSKTIKLDDAISLLIDPVEENDENKWIVWRDWQLNKAFSSSKSITINGFNVDYNVIHYNYNQVTVVPSPSEDRIIPKSGRIIVYYYMGAINYIIDQNSNAQKMLRRLLSYSGKNEIEKNSFQFNSDFFIWMIFRVFNKNISIENIINDKQMILYIDAIKGFRGNTEDLQNKVSADGEAVMNLISALSFLLESSALNQIKVDIKYTNHDNISLKLQQNTVQIDFCTYQGEYENDMDDLKYAKLYLLVYLEIVPILEQEYFSDKSEGEWGEDKYKSFLNDIAKLLNDKIQEKLKIDENNQ